MFISQTTACLKRFRICPVDTTAGLSVSTTSAVRADLCKLRWFGFHFGCCFSKRIMNIMGTLRVIFDLVNSVRGKFACDVLGGERSKTLQQKLIQHLASSCFGQTRQYIDARKRTHIKQISGTLFTVFRRAIPTVCSASQKCISYKYGL